MLRNPTLPNHRTLATLFKTCATLPCLNFGVSLHCLAVKLSLSDEPFTGSSLINFYSKCRLPKEARKVFNEIPQKDEVCYAAAIVGLAQNSCVSGALRAAAELASLEQCKIIHAHAVVTRFDSNVVVGSAVVDGYCKAGLVPDARRCFDENLPSMNMVGWNAMMAGYAQQGDPKSTLELFYSMEARGLVLDVYSFLAILTSFSNRGLFLETEQWLTCMKENNGLEPWLEHYTCLVGAMGRAGRLEDAERIAMTMPFEPDAAMWRALLSTCAYHGAERRWGEVAEVRKMMKDRRVKKEGGRSWVEVQGKVHIFLAGDRRHERSEEIYHKLAELMEEIEKLGYVPVWCEMLHEVGEREEKEALWHHSEKLALAFGVVSGAVPLGKAIRIVKNLRICKDCHHAFKYTSRVLEKEIIVRDVNRYHRFLNGSCTCGDI
ncbi:Pentatricopeptide repeat-containing protein [Quillaja saponaria]|uniref:Pentatricopeptide repeat-containing protein n=1 Tax=Quillaja saponaria TaxID=32244 RepID=A0AAD7PDL5_QUISA|nr:Pentatricopeptide repeat-containing protein [Quillaja saponaria]